MAMRAGAEPASARRWPAALAWALAGLAVLSGVPAFRLLSLVWLRESPEAAPTIATVGPVALTVVSAVAVGALVASRRPRHPVGWLLLAVGLAVATNVLVEPYVKYGLVVRPGSLPAARYLVPIVYSSYVVALSCAGFVLLLTPTGSLPSPRWRWWARVAAAAPVLTVLGFAVQPDPLAPDYLGNPLAVPALAPVLLILALAGVVVTLAGLLAGAGSLVLRFRRAHGVERLQLRWLALAAACASALLLVGVVAGFLGKDPVVLASLSLCLALLPLATGAAILRYRLYDLDRIISRTVAYGLLTALLIGVYVGLVFLLGRLLDPATGDSALAVAASTLAVAALFQPARRRVQALVDRRFNRRRYDAARTIQDFSVRLRQEVDLDALTGDLLLLVDRTMQPTQASLWLRRPLGPSPRVDRPQTAASAPRVDRAPTNPRVHRAPAAEAPGGGA